MEPREDVFWLLASSPLHTLCYIKGPELSACTSRDLWRQPCESHGLPSGTMKKMKWFSQLRLRLNHPHPERSTESVKGEMRPAQPWNTSILDQLRETRPWVITGGQRHLQRPARWAATKLTEDPAKSRGAGGLVRALRTCHSTALSPR